MRGRKKDKQRRKKKSGKCENVRLVREAKGEEEEGDGERKRRKKERKRRIGRNVRW